MRLTSQRKIIVRELKKLTSHPTADEFFLILRKTLPRISLGSVYRNLEALSANGIIRKLECAGSQKRFDGDTSEHFHMRCGCCGRVYDYFGGEAAKAVETITEICRRESFSSYNLEFSGTCTDCK